MTVYHEFWFGTVDPHEKGKSSNRNFDRSELINHVEDSGGQHTIKSSMINCRN